MVWEASLKLRTPQTCICGLADGQLAWSDSKTCVFHEATGMCVCVCAWRSWHSFSCSWYVKIFLFPACVQKSFLVYVWLVNYPYTLSKTICTIFSWNISFFPVSWMCLQSVIYLEQQFSLDQINFSNSLSPSLSLFPNFSSLCLSHFVPSGFVSALSSLPSFYVFRVKSVAHCSPLTDAADWFPSSVTFSICLPAKLTAAVFNP